MESLSCLASHLATSSNKAKAVSGSHHPLWQAEPGLVRASILTRCLACDM